MGLKFWEFLRPKSNTDGTTHIIEVMMSELVDAAREWLNHVHISEPGLALPEKRELHKELAKYLKETAYERFVSLEVKTQEKIQDVKNALYYMQEIFM